MATNILKERTRELIAQFCEGNDDAFAELYDLYIQMLNNYGSKLTQDQELLKDCIHDVFVKVYLKRNDKNGINNFASYLLISLKNKLLDEFRRRTFSSEDPVENFDYRYSTADVEGDYLSQEFRDQLQAITLYYIEERKYDEICEIMHMNYHSVRNLMHRGMLKLREAAFAQSH